MRLTALLAATAVGLSSTPTQAETWCGAHDLDLGGGARLVLYMFDASSEFRLFLDIPSSNVTLRGLKQEPKPWRLTISGELDTLKLEPDIGISFDVQTPEAGFFAFRQTQIVCGGIPLAYPTSWGPRLSKYGSAVGFSDLYRAHETESARCLRDLRNGKELELVFSDDADPPRQAVIKTHLPLEKALTQARAFWERQIKDAKAGRCVMSPPMPPIPVLPPPPPPQRSAP